MISQNLIDGYLRFLLRYRKTVTLIVVLLTAYFCYALKDMRLNTDFFDFYPRQHPYIKIYQEFRKMFGSANILQVVVERKDGQDIYNPATLQKIDRITKFIINTKGVVPYQVLSIASPKMKSINTFRGSIQIREVFYPGVPKTQEDAERVRFAVYSTRGIRGLYVAEDGTAAMVSAGFWEESLDFNYLNERLDELRKLEVDNEHNIYITGFPYLFASVMTYARQVVYIFAATFLTLAVLLYVYFRTWTGIWVPLFSALLSSIWGLAFGVLLGFNIDPLVLVIPIFLTARALSHSVQSMDRYHEEFYRLGDKTQAIVVSYSHLFAPAIAALVTDGLGILLVAIAPIPLIQKVSLFAAFWIVSIFVSVVTLHPIILSYIEPPPPPTGEEQNRFSERVYRAITDATIWASEGWRRWAVISITLLVGVGAFITGRSLKVGDMSPGAALLFPDHPYNVAERVLNSKFLGGSQLIVIADAQHPDGIKTRVPLEAMQQFADDMLQTPGAGMSITIVEIIKQLQRLYREGDPKWGFIPDSPRSIAELFYTFTQSGQAGDLDRFIDPSFQYGTIITLFHGHSHDIIMSSIAHASNLAEKYANEAIQFRLAGGIFGILAAVNQEVENTYWTTLSLVFLSIAMCLYLTYGSLVATLILMVPVFFSQFLAEAVMVLWHIDLNVNSLPIAAAGAGAGVDYGIYHFSRMLDFFDEGHDIDEGVDLATATTGKAIIFTATTMLAATGYWGLSGMKFQGEMGLLLAVLMALNTVGGLVVVPSVVKVVRPKILIQRRDAARARMAREAAEAGQAGHARSPALAG